MRRPNQPISRKDLMGLIWKTGYVGDTRTLDVHVRWLRKKIEPEPRRPLLLVTKRGIGYVLVVPELETPSDEADEQDPD
jgi:two-component system response regulator RegX3